MAIASQSSVAEYRPDPAGANRTDLSLLARGVDLQTARRLRQGGWTLAKLQQLTDEKLLLLGIQSEQLFGLRRGGRPEVPIDHVVQVLFANRFTCCVCRDRAKSIVIHHIIEWSKSHDHSLSNLAAICLDCHGKAHTVHQLSRNLSPEVLQGLKGKWEEAVLGLDAQSILDASRQISHAWLYVNHFRLFQLAASSGIPLERNPRLAAAIARGLATDDGHLTDRRPGRTFYMYEGGDGGALYSYVVGVLNAVFSKVSVFNASDLMDRTVLRPTLKQGDFLYVQGRHTLRSETRHAEGAEQTRRGTRRANGVRFSYTFNAWEATSSSARSRWLCGSRDVGSILRVLSFTHKPGCLDVEGSVFAICQPLPEQKRREYATVVYRDRLGWPDDE